MNRPKIRETLELLQSLIDARKAIKDEYFEPADARIMAGWLGNLAARLHADGQRKAPDASPQAHKPDNLAKARMIRACIDGLPDLEVTNELAADAINAGLHELSCIADELDEPKKPKPDVQAELAKLRAMLGVPKAVKPAPQGIEREALVDELNKIAAMLGEYEPKFSPLASRLFTLSCRIHREGVYVDDSVPF